MPIYRTIVIIISDYKAQVHSTYLTLNKYSVNCCLKLGRTTLTPSKLVPLLTEDCFYMSQVVNC